MRNRLLYVVTLLALGLSAGPAVALPCVGFTDVEDTSSFCPNVEWLKNRAITLGCTSTTTYCPSDPVTRLSMAVFMNRLGKALTPVVLHKELYLTTNVTVGSPAGGQLLCQMDNDYAVTDFPRTARFSATVYGVPLATAWLVGWWRYSTDAGTTWNNVPNTTTQRDWAGTGQVAGFSVMAPPMDLEVGTSYRFALFGSAMGSTYTFNPFGCQIEAVITNRNAATSPFDGD